MILAASASHDIALPVTRHELEDYIASLIDLLDSIEPDPDLEPNGDEEPSLGSIEPVHAYVPPMGFAWKPDYYPRGGLQADRTSAGSQTCWAYGGLDDLEADYSDDEPSLAAVEGAQSYGGYADDREQDDSDREPSLATPEGAQGYAGNGAGFDEREADDVAA